MRRHVILICLILSVFPLTLIGQSCNWYCISSGGQNINDNGSTIGQTVAANFSQDGDSVSYGFWELSWNPIICIGVDNLNWYACDTDYSDTTDLGETVTMSTEDVITVSNCSNCWIDLGLYWDSSSDDSRMQIGYTPSEDRGVIRAQFRNDSEPPIVFNGMLDYLKPSVSWADNFVFGPHGYSIENGGMTNLWFQFLSPVELTSLEPGYYRIPVVVIAKLTMP